MSIQNDLSESTSRNLLNEDFFKRLSKDEQLDRITTHLPDLLDHPVAKLFPRMSKGNELVIEASLLSDGQVAPIYITEDFKIVKNRGLYKVLQKLHYAGKLKDKPVFRICTNPEVTRINLIFHVKKYSSDQEAALLILTGIYAQIQQIAKSRMGRKYDILVELFPELLAKGTAAEMTSKVYDVSRKAIEDAWDVRKYDIDNGTNYLQFVADGKATAKQIIEELCGCLSGDYIKHMVVKLTDADSTYDNAKKSDDLYDKNGKVKSSQKNGAVFAQLDQEWKKARRDELREAAKLESEEAKDDADIANKTCKFEDAPNSHSHEEQSLNITDDALYDTKVILTTIHTSKEVRKVSIFFHRNKFNGEEYSIQFIDEKEQTKYFNVPALYIVTPKSPICHSEVDSGLKE